MKRKSGVTILELLIALCIFSMIFLGFTAIQLFSRHSFLSAKRRAVVQNELMLVLEHLTKSVTGTNFSGGAIGDKDHFPVYYTSINGYNGFKIWIDTDRDGKLGASDGQIGYVYRPYQILFYNGVSLEPVTTGHIVDEQGDLKTGSDTYISYNSAMNYLEVQITGRWDPIKQVSRDNPQVVIRTRIKMPSVSVN
jgi:hypothetical protein